MRGPVPTRDHYRILGIDRGATAAEIKAAYRTLALRDHPDRNPGDRAAEERFKDLSEAYAVLSDPERRDHYDRFGETEGPFPSGAGPVVENAAEFFDAVLGDLFGWDRRRTSGEDLRYTLELSFAEAALGCGKTIKFPRLEDCRACAGSGAEGGAAGLVACARCEGRGHTDKKSGRWASLFAARRECLTCGGTGQVPRIKCSACLGRGLMEREREFTVRVPPGTVKDGAQRMPGEGAPGRRGGPAGDLHVLLRIRPHPFFSADGGRLTVEVPITFAEAALGGEIGVPVLDGMIRLKIPAGTQSGAVFRARGKGLPDDAGTRGDLHVRVAVETPVALDDRAVEALRGFVAMLDETMQPRRGAFDQATTQETKPEAKQETKTDGKPGS